MVPDDQQGELSDATASAAVHDVAWLSGRRSVAVKRLGLPGPTDAQLHEILSAALTAPDHGALRPWRVVVCSALSRSRLADLFVAAKLQASPAASETELAREREKAHRPPVLLALISAPTRGLAKVPEYEQIATAGAALQSILIAAHGMGYGAIMLSGNRCSADIVREALQVAEGEYLLGFISIGTIVDEPRLAPRPALADMIRVFDGS